MHEKLANSLEELSEVNDFLNVDVANLLIENPSDSITANIRKFNRTLANLIENPIAHSTIKSEAC